MSDEPRPYTRTPFVVVERETARRDVYGAVGDFAVSQAHLLRGEQDSDTVYIGMHPIGAPSYFPVFTALAKGGLHVITTANRYINGDHALQMENVLVDLGACVREARERFGYEKVVLVGWSGGGAVMTGYQGEAEEPVITRTAAGEPTALAGATLQPADAVLFIAAHRSRHHLLTEFLDASILDEAHPEDKDPTLDLYDPDNPDQPPYTPEFLARYREAQRARSRRISAYAKAKLEELKAQDSPEDEHCFVVQGTMADPRWVDLTVEPNGRGPGSYLGDPRAINNGPSGLGRFTTTRSWLSQWSYEYAQVDAVDAAPRISVPTMVVVPGRDDCCPRPHQEAFYAGLKASDKQWIDLPDADHYLAGTEKRSYMGDLVGSVRDWSAERGLGPR